MRLLVKNVKEIKKAKISEEKEKDETVTEKKKGIE